MRSVLLILCLMFVPSIAYAQVEDVPAMTEPALGSEPEPMPEESHIETLMQFASDTTMCRIDGIFVVRESGHLVVLNVCGTHRLYSIEDATFREISIRQAPQIEERDIAVRTFEQRTQLRSQPAFWGTGLGLFIAAYGAGIGSTVANIGVIDSAGLSAIPIVGPLLVLTQIDAPRSRYGHYTPSYSTEDFQIGIGVSSLVIQVIGWVLIYVGSQRIPVRDDIRYTGTGFEVSF